MSYHEERAVSFVIDATGWLLAALALVGARFLWRRS